MEAIRVETGNSNARNAESSGLWDPKGRSLTDGVAVREGFLEEATS